MSLLTGPPLWGFSGIPRFSLDLNGSDEAMGGLLTVAPIFDGVSNSFGTVEVWAYRSNVAAAAKRLIDLWDDVPGTRLALDLANNGALPANPGDLEVVARGNAGAVIKRGYLSNALALDTWAQVVVGWDNAAGPVVFKVWLNGVDTAWPGGSWTIITDTNAGWAGPATDNWGVIMGRSNTNTLYWNGNWYQTNIWNVLLGDSAVASLFAFPRKRRTANFGSYTSSSALYHSWVPADWDGVDQNSLGTDYGINPGTTPINLTRVNVTDADLFGTAP